MDIDKIINDSLNSIFSSNTNLLEDAKEDLLDIIPEDERTFTSEQWAEHEQKIINIIKRVTSLSVFSTVVALKMIEEEEKSLPNSSNGQTSHLTLLKDQHSDDNEES